MDSKLISKEDNEAKFTLTFTPEEFESAIVDAYKKNKDKFVIDGFRKGKAPRKIIENHYGAEIFYDEALNEMLRAAYPEALNTLELEVIDAPRVEVGAIDKTKDIEMTATVACFPEVEVEHYRGLTVERVETAVTDEDVQRDLERMQQGQSRMETVEGRRTADGDTVIIDFSGSIAGKAFDGGSAENFELKLGNGQFIPGFEDQLLDKEAGQEVTVTVTFPEDYGAKDLAGKEAVFQTKIHEIKKEVLPEIDDELASDVSEFETLDELKADLRKKLKERAAERDESEMKNRLIATLYEENEVDVPPVMVEDEIDLVLQEMNQQLAYQGLSIDQYLKYVGQSMAELREGAREEARKRAAIRILIRGVMRQEAIEASEEEIREELQKMADQYGETLEQVETLMGEEGRRRLREEIKSRKAVDLIFREAKQIEPDDAAKEAEDSVESNSQEDKPEA